MNERRFNGLITKLRNPERLERLQIDRVMAYSLAGTKLLMPSMSAPAPEFLPRLCCSEG